MDPFTTRDGRRGDVTMSRRDERPVERRHIVENQCTKEVRSVRG